MNWVSILYWLLGRKVQRRFYPRNLTSELRNKLIKKYWESKRRLIMLDYDGTLVPFADKPCEAKPDEDVLRALRSLSQKKGNEVVIVSGRDRMFLDEWFGGIPLSLVAEHGAWIKEKDAEWRLVMPMEDGWKRKFFPVLRHYVSITPGSFLEEKDSSLVWHYRMADPVAGEMSARELKNNITGLAARFNLEVLEGNRTIEIKVAGVNKGTAALRWISKGGWDFVLAVGDDATDEDMFAVLPSSAYSIKVGTSPSRARFTVRSVEEVRLLLKEMACEPLGVELGRPKTN